MPLPILPLEHLADRHAGLTAELAASYLQAAQVCLDLHHHPPAEFTIRDESGDAPALVDWPPSDERARWAWANRNDATENGAYACALATVELTRGLVAVRRAETTSGADFYIVPIGKQPANLKEWIRLEISGTHLEEAEVKTRLRRKIKQAARGRSSLPAIAMVVGFKARLIAAQDVGEKL